MGNGDYMDEQLALKDSTGDGFNVIVFAQFSRVSYTWTSTPRKGVVELRMM